MTTQNHLITIHCIGGEYFVWNAEHVYELRVKHRICGALVGALSRKPWQTSVNSLPLMLMPEEVTLCLSEGVANLVYNKKETDGLFHNKDYIIDFWNKRNALEHEQICLFKRRKMEKELMFYGNNKKLKRKERKRFAKGKLNVDEGLKTEVNSTHIKVKEEAITEVDSALDNCQSQSSQKEVLTSDLTNNENLKFDEKVQDCLPDVTEDDIDYYYSSVRVHIPTALKDQTCLEILTMDFPSSSKQQSCNLVFKYFWKLGYFLTSAAKFGGDYLVYPGDPLRYHSFFIVLVRDCEDGFTSKDLISYGRLAASVKKTVILSHVDNDQNVKCLSLEWSCMK